MIQNSFKLIVSFSLILLIGTVFYGCSGDDKAESKSMEEIQKEEGFPVIVKKIGYDNFTKELTFFGKFKGEKETTVGAMIGGRIDKINYRPGARVKKGDVIIQFPEDAPASQFIQAKSALENSEKNYKRMKALFEKGQIAQAQFDGAETKYLVDKRNYETMLDMLKLDAPYDGVITEILVQEGDNVKDKTPLFTIAQLDRMKIRIWLTEYERSQIKKGMKATATVGGKTFTGKVDEISLNVNPMRQAFYADILFHNSKHEILAGTTADVKIIILQKNEAILIPRNLVKTEGAKHFVYLASGKKAKKTYVNVADENGVNYLISSGLNIGDSLIVKGVERLSDGSKLKIVK